MSPIFSYFRNKYGVLSTEHSCNAIYFFRSVVSFQLYDTLKYIYFTDLICLDTYDFHLSTIGSQLPTPPTLTDDYT